MTPLSSAEKQCVFHCEGKTIVTLLTARSIFFSIQAEPDEEHLGAKTYRLTHEFKDLSEQEGLEYPELVEANLFSSQYIFGKYQQRVMERESGPENNLAQGFLMEGASLRRQGFRTRCEVLRGHLAGVFGRHSI